MSLRARLGVLGVYLGAIAGGWSFGGSLGELRKNRVSVSSSTPRILPDFACPVRHPRVGSRWANSGKIMECGFGLRAVQLGKALRGTVPGVEHTETRGYAASSGITAASAVVVELSFQGTRQIACRFGSVNASPSRLGSFLLGPPRRVDSLCRRAPASSSNANLLQARRLWY